MPARHPGEERRTRRVLRDLAPAGVGAGALGLVVALVVGGTTAEIGSGPSPVPPAVIESATAPIVGGLAEAAADIEVRVRPVVRRPAASPAPVSAAVPSPTAALALALVVATPSSEAAGGFLRGQLSKTEKPALDNRSVTGPPAPPPPMPTLIEAPVPPAPEVEPAPVPSRRPNARPDRPDRSRRPAPEATLSTASAPTADDEKPAKHERSKGEDEARAKTHDNARDRAANKKHRFDT